MRKRYGGTLMHISSLDGDFGIGTLGSMAYKFCDFLADSGFSAWQTLPINPQGPGFSPYNSISAFAGNPLFIDPELLCEDGLITLSELDYAKCENCGRVDYKTVILKNAVLTRAAFSRFSDFDALDEFCKREGDWVCDYASFMTIREELGGIAWHHFPHELRDRSALAAWREEHKDIENYYKFEQYIFSKQWDSLRKYAAARGISLIGDVPIYVAGDSCDVWSSPQIFNLSENLTPIDVSGCPPDSFSESGQLWGNPTYRWDILERENYSWWISRLSRCSALFDMIRLDHFRAFESFWSVPFGATDARFGEWKKGPGKAFFDTVKRNLPNLTMIAEDLGLLTDEVFKLRDEAGIPGMRVLQFAFDDGEDNLYLPHMYTENSVVYTGTHDNDTLSGFIKSSPEKRIRFMESYLSPKKGETLEDALLRAAWSSVADVAIAPVQDFLRLSNEARMNTPSTVNDSNWRFRIKNGALTRELSAKLLSLNRESFRI